MEAPHGVQSLTIDFPTVTDTSKWVEFLRGQIDGPGQTASTIVCQNGVLLRLRVVANLWLVGVEIQTIEPIVIVDEVTIEEARKFLTETEG